MAQWSSGYVSDLAYTLGFYREMTPALMRFVALCKGIRAPSTDGEQAYCELGCGQGLTANIVAAANPNLQVFATDFNPAHVVSARDMASRGSLSNAHFFDDSFIDFAARADLPDFDFVALHGIYSWINLENREVIRDFIRRKLKPGGLVYVSYNCAPGWAPAIPLRALMYMHGQQLKGPTAARVKPSLDFLKEISDLGAAYFKGNPQMDARLERLQTMNSSYVAHEYFNESWFLPFFADVADFFGEAKLTFLGSAALLDHVDAVHLSPEQSAFVRALPDPVFAETVRDFMVNQQFRRDVFIKGAVGETVLSSRRAWSEQHLMLVTDRQSIKMVVNGARGEATLQTDVYNPVLDALAEGPQSMGYIERYCEKHSVDWNRLLQAIVVLVGAGYVHPCCHPDNFAQADKQASRFNESLVLNSYLLGDVNTFASGRLQSGITVGRLEQLFLLAQREGARAPTDWATFAMKTLERQGQQVVKDGKPVVDPQEALGELNDRAKTFSEVGLPLLVKFGAV